MENSSAILSVVEAIPLGSLAFFKAKVADTKFWQGLIPLKTPVFDQIAPDITRFEIDDTIRLDAAGFLQQPLLAKGQISITDYGMQGAKGNLWSVKIDVLDPPATITARIRARELAPDKALKVGIFVEQFQFDHRLLQGIGYDAVLFAVRLYLREGIARAGKACI